MIIWWDRSCDMIRDVWSCNHSGLLGTFEQMLADSWCDHKPLWVESDNKNSRHCLSDGHQKGREWLEATGHGGLFVCAASLSLCVDFWLLSINCSDGTDVSSQRLTAFLLSRYDNITGDEAQLKWLADCAKTRTDVEAHMTYPSRCCLMFTPPLHIRKNRLTKIYN